MNFWKILLTIVSVSVWIHCSWGEVRRGKPLDLAEYIEGRSSSRSPKKNGDLGTSQTLYYGYEPQQYYSGEEIDQQDYHHEDISSAYYTIDPEVFHPHQRYIQGFVPPPYRPEYEAQAHSYSDGQYGDYVGPAPVGSSHVSYGTNINHGFGRYHHEENYDYE